MSNLIKSLELLDVYFNTVDKEKIDSIFKEIDAISFDGIMFNQYLSELEINLFNTFNYNDLEQPLHGNLIEECDIPSYKVDGIGEYYKPPLPSCFYEKINKKDSVLSQSLFYLL